MISLIFCSNVLKDDSDAFKEAFEPFNINDFFEVEQAYESRGEDYEYARAHEEELEDDEDNYFLPMMRKAREEALSSLILFFPFHFI